MPCWWAVWGLRRLLTNDPEGDLRGRPPLRQRGGRWPRRRWRVHEAAQALGRTVQETLDGLKEIGEYAANRWDWIEEPVFARLAAHFNVSPPAPGEPDRDSAAIEEPHAVDRLGLTQPAALPKRDNHPYRDPGPRPRDLLNSTWVPSKPVEPDREYHAGGRWLGSGAVFADHEWALRGFTDAEKDVWLAAGLKDGQAKLAVQLAEAGLSPQDLPADLGGWTVLERVNQGEDIVAVARLYERRHGQDAG